MRKVLFGVCTLGGGHVYRDLAIGRALERLVPDTEVVYVSGGPTTEMLRAEGRHVEDGLVPAPYFIHNGRMYVLPTILGTMLAELLNGLRVLALLLRHRPVLVIMDEVGLPGLVARLWGCRFAYLANFVFWPAPNLWRHPFSGLAVRALINPTFRRLITTADVSLFLGTPSHVPTDAGRAWAAQHMVDIGPIAQGQVHAYPEQAASRARLGLEGGPVITVTVGGGRAGRFLLAEARRAWPALRAGYPRLTLVLVCGPAIDPAAVATSQPGLRVLGYTNDLLAYLAASDLAIVQAGIATVTECLELGIPMLVYPVENHWEQHYVAAYARSAGQAIVLSRDDVRQGKLAGLALEVLGDAPLLTLMSRPVAPAQSGHAAAEAARLLAGLLVPPPPAAAVPGLSWDQP